MSERLIDFRERAYQIYLEEAKKLLRGEISAENFAKEQAERYLEELRDSLTGLHRRKFFDQVIIPLVAGAERQKEPLSLIMLDLDNLKTINDKYGHLAGDRTLEAFGKIVREVAQRRSDMAARYGGEEIAVLLPNTNQNGALKLAEELLDTVRETEVDIGEEKIKFTTSVGIASFKEGMSPEKLIDNADKALYRAKDKGKNRIEIYG